MLLLLNHSGHGRRAASTRQRGLMQSVWSTCFRESQRSKHENVQIIYFALTPCSIEQNPTLPLDQAIQLCIALLVSSCFLELTKSKVRQHLRLPSGNST